MKLDKTKKYNLVLLNKEQLKELFLELKKLKGWENATFDFWSNEKNLMDCLLVYSEKHDRWYMQVSEDKKGSDNALELFDSKENSYPIQGKKESTGKCKFELDFEFIEAMSLRIENETKYEPYNWKLPLSTGELSNALLRHAIEVKKGNFDDNGELGHLMAIANNAMFLYYQLKNNK